MRGCAFCAPNHREGCEWLNGNVKAMLELLYTLMLMFVVMCAACLQVSVRAVCYGLVLVQSSL